MDSAFRERSLFMAGGGGGGRKFRGLTSWGGANFFFSILFWRGDFFFYALFCKLFFAKVTLHVL